MTEPIHPMQPAPEQFADWLAGAMYDLPAGPYGEVAAHVARKAYAAGADAELQAVERWFSHFYRTETWMNRDLRTLLEERRPRPPGLKQQAQRILIENGTTS